MFGITWLIVESILIIHWFCIYKFACLLTFICKRKIHTWGENLQLLDKQVSAHCQGATLPSCLSFSFANCIYFSVFGNTFCPFLCFLLVISLCEMAPKHSAEVPSSLPKCKKAVMCLGEKICVLDKLGSGMGLSALAIHSMWMHQQHIL